MGIFKKKKEKIQDTIVAPVGTKTLGQILAEWELTSAPDYVKSYTVTYYEDYMYLKVYYFGELAVSQKNELYLNVSALDTGWIFLGVREYNENHEMCFVFRKNGYKYE